jgi:KDO2-lipid IV(A) lauroyltransferase
VERFRTDKGMAVIPRGAALRGGMRALKAGSVLAFVMDQNAARHGVFVPLFGTAAATVPGPAELALRYGAPIILCHSRREKKGRHRLVFVEEIVPAKSRDHDEAVRRTTARINAGLEKVIRERPEEWLWFHPRWRTRPPGEPPLY